MAISTRALLHLAPIVVVSMWYLVFVVIGITCLVDDSGLPHDACGSVTHIWKYTLLNVVFAAFVMITYFVFPGGGEAVRARAVLCCIVHMAFTVWGILMWLYMTDSCRSVLSNQFPAITAFQHICVLHNVGMWMFFLIHETWLGERLGYDMTIVPEIAKGSSRGPYSTAASMPDTVHAYNQVQHTAPTTLDSIAAAKPIPSPTLRKIGDHDMTMGSSDLDLKGAL